ncbi:ROK family transcriptional regulator [Pseudomonas fuscovaginae UPB0736]|uniref:Sugar kinase of the NBD/HSP70 family, may contain an N-terminal HTH domain n=1 Tax=Pseudomonas asplenii TaxID=53407 RepID=A0A1H1U338_9PSED|nr:MULTISPECIES: ROK family transcriptional regulator [Pseudomonas]UUQ63134.1 ROK family transcriptional regulator [Pseudomonas fuscovaginae UPB0736]UZE28373.1 ROK family transcriptional regulator [Pseudomonas asplenii]SDS66945.1 Sugar kinase of the NBD/HSP70 family, may contain an N-terminal HTH domain [Pseudomonas asplenii]
MKNPQHTRTVTTGTNAEHARLHNRRVILEAIRLGGRLTRADLTRLTSLTAQTVSNIVTELQEEGVLRVHAAEKIGRGQPPVPLSINPQGGYSIGFHVEQHSIIGVLLDLLGDAQAQVTLAVSYPSFDDALPLLLDTVRQFRALRPDGRFLGVGVALPGPFSVEGMTSVGPTAMSGWDDPQIPTRLQQAVGLPVLIENDATAATMGERLYGIASDLHHFVHLFIGSGLGAGLYLGNRLYSGHWHNAGEIGHMTVVPGGKACHCGNQGCLERYISIAALLEHLGQSGDQDLAAWSIDDPRFKAGVDSWLDEAAPALRQAINILESLLDPQTILISGFLPEAILARLVARLEPLHRSISSRSDREYPRIQLGTAGHDAVALGAAALMILAEISPDYEALLKPE